MFNLFLFIPVTTLGSPPPQLARTGATPPSPAASPSGRKARPTRPTRSRAPGQKQVAVILRVVFTFWISLSAIYFQYIVVTDPWVSRRENDNNGSWPLCWPQKVNC